MVTQRNSSRRRLSPSGLGSALALSTLFLGLAACGGSDSGESDGDPIVIGVIRDESGPAAAYSAQAVDMLKFAVGKVNDGDYVGIEENIENPEAGIMGRDVSLIFEDDQSDPNLTVSLTRKLIGEGADVVLFASGSASAIQGRVVCQEEKILCIAPNNVSGAIVEQPNADYVFTIAPPSSLTGQVFIDQFEAAGYTSIGYNSDDTATAQALKDSYRDAFEAAGFTTAADEVVPAAANDMSAQISRLRDADPDVVFDMSQAASAAGLFLSSSVDGLSGIPRWATNSVTAQPEIWDIAGDGIDGLMVIDEITRTNSYTDAVAQAYTESADSDLFLAPQGMNWDAVMVIKQVMELAQSTDGEDLRKELEELSGFPSAHGQPDYTLTFSSENHNAATAKAHVIVRFEDGQPVPLPADQQPT